jgi:hypothetical protein
MATPGSQRVKPHLSITNDIPVWSWDWANYSSGEWNQAFQALLAEAVPGINPRLYTAHSLRAGALSSADKADLPLHRVSMMAVHPCQDTTRRYLRDHEVERASYSYVGVVPHSYSQP